MSNNLPDCSTFTAACTSCLFGGTYNTVDPPFVVTSTATYVPTIVVDVTTFANGSSTTNTISSATDTPEEDVLTWESDGITFTYGTTYLNYTSFQFATPSPASSVPDSASACYTGNPNDVTTTEPLLLPAETTPSSLIVTLTSDEPLPSITVPAQILSYLDSLPTVSEQLNGISLSVCSPTTAPQPSCISRTPDGCPRPTSTAVVTASGSTRIETITFTVSRATDDSNTADDNLMRKRQEGSGTTTTTSSTIDPSTIETSSSSDSSTVSSSPSTASPSTASNTSFPPGCPTATTITITQPDVTFVKTVTATQKQSTNKLNIGPASISIRSATSLPPAQAPSTTPATVLPAPQPVETSSPNPQPASPASPTQAQPTAPAAATTQVPNGQPDTPTQPAGSSLNSPEADTAAAAAATPASNAPASQQLASLSSAVQSAANAATSNSDLVPETLIPVNSTALSAAAGAAMRTGGAASTGAFSGDESLASEVVVYTTTEAYTTRIVTETRTGNVEGGSTGVGDYVQSGLGNSGGSHTGSARPVAYTGQANRIGVVDFRGLFGMGMGLWMGGGGGVGV